MLARRLLPLAQLCLSHPLNFMKPVLLLCFLLSQSVLPAQHLKPGFDPEEYMELLHVSVATVGDSAYSARHSPSSRYAMIYKSQPMALDNSWDLWTDPQGVAVISIRGTTLKTESWLENFYAAMLPAQGEMTLNTEGKKFAYALAPDPRAGVHAGWLIGMAFLSQDILPRIDSLHHHGVREFIIFGHSQGGSIAYLLTAHLLSLQAQGTLASDIQLKTYCSAGPKPGNLFFAHHYESLTQNGWAYNVVSSLDWVPQVPISIQTIDDFSTTNPFRNAGAMIKAQKMPNRLVMKHVYKKLDKPTRKAQKNYEKYLGDMTSKMVVKVLPGLEIPPFMHSNHYVRTGNLIVLTPNEAYLDTYPEDSEAIFTHHIHAPYMMLMEQNFLLKQLKQNSDDEPAVMRLHDTWALESMGGKDIDVNQFSGTRPYLELYPKENKLSGYGGCNSLHGELIATERKLSIHNIGASRKWCGDENMENALLQSLQGDFEWEFRDLRLYLSKDGTGHFVFRKMD